MHRKPDDSCAACFPWSTNCNLSSHRAVVSVLATATLVGVVEKRRSRLSSWSSELRYGSYGHILDANNRSRITSGHRTSLHRSFLLMHSFAATRAKGRRGRNLLPRATRLVDHSSYHTICTQVALLFWNRTTPITCRYLLLLDAAVSHESVGLPPTPDRCRWSIVPSSADDARKRCARMSYLRAKGADETRRYDTSCLLSAKEFAVLRDVDSGVLSTITPFHAASLGLALRQPQPSCLQHC
jgi:hypothetical protein